MNKRFKNAIQEASKQLKNNTLSGIRELIYNLGGIIKEVEVNSWDFIKNGDGIIENCHKDKCIFIINIPTQYLGNIENQDRKKAFVLAHELGHYLLHMRDTNNNHKFYDTKSYRRTLDFRDMIEIEAEYFAYNLILGSEDNFKEYTKNLQGTTEEKIKLISDKYNINTKKVKFICNIWDIAL